MSASRGARLAALLALLACTACDPEVVVGYSGLSDDGGIDASDGAPDAALPDVTWLSGAHPGNDLSTYLDFGEWRGRPLAIAHVFVDRLAWDGVVSPGWPVDMFEPFDGLLVISVPPYAEGLGTNLDCAMGAYDDEWASLGTFLNERGRPDTILRLGWGPNDLQHEWHVASNADGTANATDLQDWLACFRRVVDAVRSTDPEVQIDWTFNPIGGARFATFDPYLTYPGDDYVDYVGIELFDMYPPIRTQADWDATCNSLTGLCTLFDFARAHGKRVGIAEWGVVSCDQGVRPSDQIGGDNPFFVERVFKTFAANADALAYEAYFEDGGDEVCSGLKDSAEHAASAARYRELFGGR